MQVAKQISVISNQPASQMEGLNALAEAVPHPLAGSELR